MIKILAIILFVLDLFVSILLYQSYQPVNSKTLFKLFLAIHIIFIILLFIQFKIAQ